MKDQVKRDKSQYVNISMTKKQFLSLAGFLILANFTTQKIQYDNANDISTGVAVLKSVVDEKFKNSKEFMTLRFDEVGGKFNEVNIRLDRLEREHMKGGG